MTLRHDAKHAGCFQRLDAARIIVAGEPGFVLEGSPLGRTHPLHGKRVAVAYDGSFVAALAHGAVHVHFGIWPAHSIARHAFEGAVDIALASDDALIVAADDKLLVVDLGTAAVRATQPLDKRIARIAALPGSNPLVVGVAFADGTASRVTLPPYEPVTRQAPRIAAIWDMPLAPRVRDELDRLGLQRDAEPTSVDTPHGPYPLPRYLRELFAHRHVVAPNGNSPGVWSDVPIVELFYKAMWKAAKTPKEERKIDLGEIRFAGGPRIARVVGASLHIDLASIGATSVRWVVVANTPDERAVDPLVALFDTATQQIGDVERLSEIVYRLAPGSR